MIINGDAYTVLKRMDDESVHCAVTSSPYYGLRAYGTEPQIWDGDPNCDHEWGTVHPPGYRSSDTKPGPLQSEGNKNRQNLKSDICSKCGAWKGELGQEPTPELFIKHLTQIFHELKRVLRSDGIFWANIGDSYAANRGYQVPDNAWCDVGNSKGSRVPDGMKPKDLIGIPWMLAFSLRADGWYLRADLPWIKRNSMPSSVTDRPCSSIEHVFLFSKSKKYFYDHVATMQPSSDSYNKDKRPRGVIRQCVNENGKYPNEGQFKKQDNVGNPTYTGFNDRYVDNGTGLRFMRDSDFFFKTWQGLMHNEEGEPMALVVNPRGYKGAHFACFPIQLVEPLILAGTSSYGVCPKCGAPWVRKIEHGEFVNQSWGGEHVKGIESAGGVGPNSCLKTGGTREILTTGWEPSCKCYEEAYEIGTKEESNEEFLSHPEESEMWKRLIEMQVERPIVIDPFGGSSATGVACKRHDRTYIGIELNPEYCKLGNQRIREGK